MTSNKWTSFPDALLRAERNGIDRANFIAALIAELASPDSKAVARGWARLTEHRPTTRAENRAKMQAADQLGLLLNYVDESSPNFPHEVARRLRAEADFEPQPAIHVPHGSYVIPASFWSFCGPADSNGESHWADDDEDPGQWTNVEWSLGTASCWDVLDGTQWGEEHNAHAHWEFSALEITSTAIDKAIRLLDVAAQERRIEHIDAFPLDNKYAAFEHFVTKAQCPDFKGWKRGSFFDLWGQRRPPGKRGRKPNAQAS